MKLDEVLKGKFWRALWREPRPRKPHKIPEGLERLSIPGSGGDFFIQYPKNLTAAQLEVINSAVETLRLSVQARKAGQEAG